MNSFYEHHKGSVRWHYRCFDRILLSGLIQPFQQPERVVGFFNTYRQLYPVSRQTLRGISEQFQHWLKGWSEKRNIPVVEAPKGRRDDFVDPYFKRACPDAVVVILKAREPARIMTAVGDSKANRWHLQIANRWVVQYNFYINDRQWGRMFVRICPSLPFSARVCLNQHHWLANRMRVRRLAHPLGPVDLQPKVAGASYPVLYRKGAGAIRLPASAVLLAGRVLRQPHLPSPRGTGQPR
jgi:hypothetical protein